jgi:hypothetical protein
MEMLPEGAFKNRKTSIVPRSSWETVCQGTHGMCTLVLELLLAGLVVMIQLYSIFVLELLYDFIIRRANNP